MWFLVCFLVVEEKACGFALCCGYLCSAFLPQCAGVGHLQSVIVAFPGLTVLTYF